MKYIHSLSDIRNINHYAVILFQSVTIPGDERSRTAPGHGYPEHTEHYCEYIEFDDEKELRAWLHTHGHEKYLLIDAKVLKVEKKITFDLKTL
jgi:hypothetical protein